MEAFSPESASGVVDADIITGNSRVFHLVAVPCGGVVGILRYDRFAAGRVKELYLCIYSDAVSFL